MKGMRPPLFVDRLLRAGFAKVGAWQILGQLTCGSTSIPAAPGVYAFSIHGRVMYVGKASKSVRQRMYGYTTPGKDQATNIRLKDALMKALEDSSVEIHVATPKDLSWNGLPILAVEGLEAGLIRDFELPWNKLGAGRRDTSYGDPRSAALAPKGPRLADRIVELVKQRPGLTERQIAEALFGKGGYQQKVNPVCRRLTTEGKLTRKGSGYQADPFTYHSPKCI